MSSNRFHLNDQGPAPCEAKSDETCPIAKKTGLSDHYDSIADAQRAFEQLMESKLGGALSHKAKKPKVQSVDAEPFDLVEDPPALESGTLIKANDGTLIVISDNLTFNEFGAYMLGNLSNEPSIAKRLHELDPLKEYQEGSCDLLSFALMESNPDIVAVDEIVNEHGEMWHSIARHKDGYYIDSLGRWDETDLLDYWESVGIREDEEGFTLNHDVHERGTKPNFSPPDDLSHLVEYLNSLTK